MIFGQFYLQKEQKTFFVQIFNSLRLVLSCLIDRRNVKIIFRVPARVTNAR